MLNWGVISAGGIASVFCNAMRFSKTGRISAVASRSGVRAKELANKFSIPKHYSDYESLLADDQIDVVYISNIHPAHAEWTIKAAQAGKHILVEKPIGMNSTEAESMIEAAQQNDIFLMEAFSYRPHPQTKKLVEIIQEGRIGRVQMLRAVFSYRSDFDPDSRLFAKELGGGAILDVGCYTTSMSLLLAGAASGKPIMEPVEVKGSGKIGPTGIDHYAAATVKFENDVIAELICGMSSQVPSELTIYGTDGMLHVPDPWLLSAPTRYAENPLPLDTVFPSSSIFLRQYKPLKEEEIQIQVDRGLFVYEADSTAEYIENRQSPVMTWEDSMVNMKILDRWLEDVGVNYDVG